MLIRSQVSESVQDLNKSFPAVSKTVTEDDVRSIANPRNAQNLPRLEQIRDIAGHTNPMFEQSARDAIIEGHTYQDMETGNEVRALFGNVVNEGPVDHDAIRRRNHYSKGKATGNSRVQYGDVFNQKKGIWDD